MVFWGIEVKPGEPQAYDPKNEERKLHLTQATLGAGSGKEKSVIQCSVGGNSPVYLCSLLPNKSECCPLKLEFDYNDEAVEFSVTGDRSIHLSGFLEAYDEEECEDQYDEEEDDSDGIDIGDDSESGESEYDSEEDEDDLEDFIDHNLDMYRQSSVPNSGVVIEEIEDDETPVKDDKTKRSKKKKSQASKDENANKQIIVKESAHAPVLESEDEDGLPISKEKTLEVEKKSAAKVDLGDDEQGSNKKRKAKAPEQKSVNKNKKKKNQKEKKNEEADEKVETEDVLKKEETSQSSLNPNAQTGAVNNAMGESSETQVQSAEKKKKKKKKSNEEAKEESKAISSRTYPNGLVVEEIKMGKPDGKKATPGKQVSVSYTGKLQENGKVFDSNKSGFKFRLGVGQVIKGWDVGVNGMRVGDKRKLTIPPSMGYGAHGAGGDIPPNAWLSFDVELLDVK